jgi:ribosome-associated translation inhibitor RaiA
VIVTAPPRQHHKGKIYHVSIDIRLPGKKIVVARDPGNPSHDNGYIAIRDAFEAARRQLKKLVRQKRNRYQRTPKTTIPEIL